MSYSELQTAWQFLQSEKGKYIIGQALSIAIKTLSTVEGAEQEKSNIEQMQYLERVLFPMYSEIQRAMADWRNGGAQ